MVNRRPAPECQPIRFANRVTYLQSNQIKKNKTLINNQLEIISKSILYYFILFMFVYLPVDVTRRLLRRPLQQQTLQSQLEIIQSAFRSTSRAVQVQLTDRQIVKSSTKR